MYETTTAAQSSVDYSIKISETAATGYRKVQANQSKTGSRAKHPHCGHKKTDQSVGSQSLSQYAFNRYIRLSATHFQPLI